MFKNTPILLINLYNRPDRLLNSLEQLRKVNMSDFITRIEACNEDYAKLNMYKYLTIKAFQNIQNIQNTMIIPNFRALACALSHIKCWQYLLDSQNKGCFIVEDDITISKPHKFQFELEQVKNIVNKISDKSKEVFISFNSKQVKIDDDNYTINYYIPPEFHNYRGYEYYNNRNVNHQDNHNLEVIKYPIVGTHFYYISKGMAKYLVEKLNKITYQIDIEIGLLAGKNTNPDRKNLFLNLKTNSIKQNIKFKTDIQYYNIDENELCSVLNLPFDVIKIIYDFIPQCFKKMRTELYQTFNRPLGNSSINYLINYTN